FPDAAFLIRNRDDGSHFPLPPPMRMTICADAIQQPGPYMWVQLAESPLGLGPTLRSQPIPAQGKSGNLKQHRWKSQVFGFGAVTMEWQAATNTASSTRKKSTRD
ncbi:MAG: hypothetical protein WA817_18255, partial [Candidatus Acidiferrum sp.]